MTEFTLDQLLDFTVDWLVTGNLNAAIFADDFHFVSPFWKTSDKAAFLAKFLDPREYREKSLANILRFDPIIKLKSDDHRYFSITLQYHTKYGVSVDEAVLGTVKNGLITELRSIYDLAKTKEAHRL